MDNSQTKSRNYLLKSRSGENIKGSNNKDKGGFIYKNYLSMASNKDAMVSGLQDEDKVNCSVSKMIGVMTSKNDRDKKNKSDNSFIKNFSLNKTVIVNSNQHIHRAPTQVQNQPLKNNNNK